MGLVMSRRITRSSLGKEAVATLSDTHKTIPQNAREAIEKPIQKRKLKGVKSEPAGDSPPRKRQTIANNAHARPRTIVKQKEEEEEEEEDKFPSSRKITQQLPQQHNSRKSKGSRVTIKSENIKLESADDDLLTTTSMDTSAPTPEKIKGEYGLTPGQSPYPNWPHPTPEECEEVVRLLSSVHGEVKPPDTIPLPSLTASGCGEVPSVLDALIRTRLSAATSDKNSSRSFAGLVSKFGILKEGVGKGSVNWNAVRLADTKDIFEAIKCGGLADVKSKDIKKILQMVWEENQERRKDLKSSSPPLESQNEASEEKDVEIARAEKDVLSLDHLHHLSSENAFNALTKYPGIGPKTASCVLLFCLQRPSFAVDTHVFRLCKWLGWVPPPGDPAGLAPGAKGPFAGPTRNSTYAHCDVRIPDRLKYPLHKLLIMHGRKCPRCRAITGVGSEGWDQGCVLDHLVKRTGGKKV